MKFTFKTNKPTGPYRSFFESTYNIKWNKVCVGEFFTNKEGAWRIHLRIMKDEKLAPNLDDGNKNCPWVWVRLKQCFPTIEAAKEYINLPETIARLHSTLTIVKE